MVLIEYPLISACFFICFSILAYGGITFGQRLLRRYRNAYIQSVGVNLKDLFLLFDPEEILTLGIALAFGLGLLCFLFTGSLILAFLGASVGIFLPRVFLKYAKRKRLELLGLQLVDGLTLVSNALRVGQSLPQAFSLLVTEMSPPISQEFGILVKEYELGVPIETCLKNLADRVPSNELQLFVNSILICGQTGGNLTETFDNIAMVIRERVRLEGKIQSMTAEGRTQGVVLTLMPLFLGLAFYWVDPVLIEMLFTTMLGKVLLFLIVALDLSAYFITRKIVDIDI